jgi:VanZ family protein
VKPPLVQAIPAARRSCVPGIHRGRLTVASIASAAVVLSSPFMGELRASIRAAFPAQFQWIVSSVIAAAVAVGLIVALVRIRDRRAWRFTALAVGFGTAAVYARLVASGNADVDVVERFHFVEYGLLACLFYRAWRPVDNGVALVWALLAGVFVGILDESLQWFVPARVGEMHDIFIDAVAVACGLCFACSVDPPSRLGVPLHRGTIRPTEYALSVVLFAFALFFQVVHLGHQLYDPEIGIFRSRYTAEDLLASARDRAERWHTQPPVVLHRLSREDQYLSEGLWHVQERNLAWTHGDPFTAWRENRILEMFFAPVLDSPSYGSPTPPRWTPEQRAQTESGAGGDPGFYISRAAPYPIYTWSPVAFWSAVAAVIAGLLTAS